MNTVDVVTRVVVESCRTLDQFLVGMNYCYILLRKLYLEHDTPSDVRWEIVNMVLEIGKRKKLLDSNTVGKLIRRTHDEFLDMVQKKYDMTIERLNKSWWVRG